MRRLSALALGALLLVGCAKTPSDADQQALVEEWSPENVAKEYEKKGMHKEAEEVRRTAQQGQQ